MIRKAKKTKQKGKTERNGAFPWCISYHGLLLKDTKAKLCKNLNFPFLVAAHQDKYRGNHFQTYHC